MQKSKEFLEDIASIVKGTTMNYDERTAYEAGSYFGYDVGFEFALKDWMKNHRENWLKERRKKANV